MRTVVASDDRSAVSRPTIFPQREAPRDAIVSEDIIERIESDRMMKQYEGEDSTNFHHLYQATSG
ncbi:hypothetical protein EAE99_003254 [Botrytis elliptica]|nr:hypothetical protein EAE99_003254 [Botrytis elliptica]